METAKVDRPLSFREDILLEVYRLERRDSNDGIRRHRGAVLLDVLEMFAERIGHARRTQE